MSGTYHDPPRWRAAAECPECGAGLRLRRRRADGGPFFGCARFPTCRFVEDFHRALAGLAEHVVELEDKLAALQIVRAEPPTELLEKELRGLIAIAHPDKWPPENQLAHLVTRELTRLRDSLRVAA